MAGYLRIQAEGSNGLCVLRVSGEVDVVTAEEVAERAEQALQAVPGPVMVDLSDVTFIDACGGRALAAMIDTLPAGRLTAIRSCAPHVRLVLDLLDLSLNYLPADYLSAENWTAPRFGTRELMSRVQEARLQASVVKDNASGVLAMLADTDTRLAITLEQTQLIREQGRRVLASARAAREHAIRSRQQTAT
jgi:anti-sigma B factor antagonist